MERVVENVPRQNEAVRPRLPHVSLAEPSVRTGIDTRRPREYRQGKRVPRAERVGAIIRALGDLREVELQAGAGVEHPADIEF